MHKTMDGSQMNFQNGKQLLQSCICKLNEKQRGETGGNVALYPTVIVMMGCKSRCNTEYIKSTLDDNWNNARFLQYLNVVKTDSGWECFRLASASEEDRFARRPAGTSDGNTPACKPADASGEGTLDASDGDTFARRSAVTSDGGTLTGTSDGDAFAWRPSGTGWNETLNSAIVTMLETEEKIFSKRTTVKLEYVLDATETDSRCYFDLFRETVNELQSDELKTLYLMLDQRPGADRVEASDALLKYMVDGTDASELSGTVYLLSNYLQSGQMLGDGRIWQNYRLAADIMLLGGNRREAQGVVQKLFRGFKTVSYALVTKPTEEIAAVSLRTLLSEIYAAEYKNLFRELSASEISGKLQLDRYHGFLFLEEWFEKKIRPKFPKETDWKYLPFQSIQGYRKFLKDPNMTIETANAATCGAAAEYLHRQYLEPVREFLANEKEMQQCRESISQLLSAQFAYFELLYLQEHREELNGLILAEYRFAGFRPKDGCLKRLHGQAVYESRRLFYQEMKQVIAAEMEQLLQRALYFRDLYEACTKEIRQECIVTGDESKSVEKFYGGIVSEYVGRCQKVNEHVPAFPEVFCVTNEKEELLGALWNLFLDLMREKVYDCDFEQEVDYRMDGMDEKQRHEFVAKELRKKLEGSRRLKNSIEIPMAEAGCYYLINARADYAKTLERAGSREYVLFDLSRTDCIEQLEIHDILKPQQLRLGCVRTKS